MISVSVGELHYHSLPPHSHEVSAFKTKHGTAEAKSRSGIHTHSHTARTHRLPHLPPHTRTDPISDCVSFSLLPLLAYTYAFYYLYFR